MWTSAAHCTRNPGMGIPRFDYEQFSDCAILFFKAVLSRARDYRLQPEPQCAILGIANRLIVSSPLNVADSVLAGAVSPVILRPIGRSTELLPYSTSKGLPCYFFSSPGGQQSDLPSLSDPPIDMQHAIMSFMLFPDTSIRILPSASMGVQQPCAC